MRLQISKKVALTEDEVEALCDENVPIYKSYGQRLFVLFFSIPIAFMLIRGLVENEYSESDYVKRYIFAAFFLGQFVYYATSLIMNRPLLTVSVRGLHLRKQFIAWADITNAKIVNGSEYKPYLELYNGEEKIREIEVYLIHMELKELRRTLSKYWSAYDHLQTETN